MNWEAPRCAFGRDLRAGMSVSADGFGGTFHSQKTVDSFVYDGSTYEAKVVQVA